MPTLAEIISAKQDEAKTTETSFLDQLITEKMKPTPPKITTPKPTPRPTQGPQPPGQKGYWEAIGHGLALGTTETTRAVVAAGPRIGKDALQAAAVAMPALDPYAIPRLAQKGLKLWGVPTPDLPKAPYEYVTDLADWIGSDRVITEKLTELKKAHPEWTPQKLESVGDILKNPTILVEQLAATAPYMAGAIGATLAGGPGLAFQFAYAVEGQNAYEEAIRTGATKEQAEAQAQIVGSINGLIEAFSASHVLSIAKAAKRPLIDMLIKKATKKAAQRGALGKLARGVLGLVAAEAVEEMSQGTTEELTALGIQGRNIQPGFINRRLIEGTIGASAGLLFGGMAKGVAKATGAGKPAIKDQGAPIRKPTPPSPVPMPKTAKEAANLRIDDWETWRADQARQIHELHRYEEAGLLEPGETKQVTDLVEQAEVIRADTEAAYREIPRPAETIKKGDFAATEADPAWRRRFLDRGHVAEDEGLWEQIPEDLTFREGPSPVSSIQALADEEEARRIHSQIQRTEGRGELGPQATEITEPFPLNEDLIQEQLEEQAPGPALATKGTVRDPVRRRWTEREATKPEGPEAYPSIEGPQKSPETQAREAAIPDILGDPSQWGKIKTTPGDIWTRTEAEEAQQLKETLKGKLKQALFGFAGEETGAKAPLDAVETMQQMVRLGYLYAKAGAGNFAAWAERMIGEFGQGIKPHLRPIWNQIRNLPALPPEAETGVAEAVIKSPSFVADEQNPEYTTVGAFRKPGLTRQKRTTKDADGVEFSYDVQSVVDAAGRLEQRTYYGMNQEAKSLDELKYKISQIGKDVTESQYTPPALTTGEEPGVAEPTPQAPLFGDETGAVPLTGLWNSIKGVARKFMTSAGDLPKGPYVYKEIRDAHLKAEVVHCEFLAKAFQRATIKAYGFRGPNAEQSRLISAVGKGEADPSVLPEVLQEPLHVLRNHIDVLSDKLLASGLIQGDLVLTFEQNKGHYLHRSYRAFDPGTKWKKQVLKTPTIINNAIAYIRDMRPDLSESEALAEVHSILDSANTAENPVAFFSERVLGQKRLDVLKRRKGLDPAIRALLGEHEDFLTNYLRTVTSMTQLLANHKFLTQVREEGLGKIFFEDKPQMAVDPYSGKEVVAYDVKITNEKNPSLTPLSGLYTTPEIKQAFEDAVTPEEVGKYVRFYLKFNSPVKYGKTVGSAMTHVRNFTGNIMFAVRQGHWRLGKAGIATQSVLNKFLLHPGSPENIAYIDEAIRYGVMEEGARGGEIKAILGDISKYDSMEKVAGLLNTRVLQKALHGVAEAYGLEDAWWKLYAWENEKARYRKAHPEWSDDQIKKHTADIVRDTYPTWSKIPRFVKGLRKWPVMGTFVSFRAECLRTRFKTLQIINREARDPKTKGIAAQRVAGMVLAEGALATTIAGVGRYLAGIDWEDDEMLRHFLPWWSALSSILWTKNDGEGNLTYIDVGYTDPMQDMQDPIRAFMQEGDLDDKFKTALWDATRPYLEEEILFKALIQSYVTNQTDTGARISNPEDSDVNQLQARMGHVAKAFEPGIMRAGRRGIEGQQERLYGKGPDTWTEFQAQVTGIRRQTLDLGRALGFAAKDHKEVLRDATQLLSVQAASSDPKATGKIEDAFWAMERVRRQQALKLFQMSQTAKRFGVKEERIQEILSAQKVGRSNIKDLMNGIYRPYRLPQATAKAIKTRAMAEGTTPGGLGELYNRFDLIERLSVEATEKDMGIFKGRLLIKTKRQTPATRGIRR